MGPRAHGDAALVDTACAQAAAAADGDADDSDEEVVDIALAVLDEDLRTGRPITQRDDADGRSDGHGGHDVAGASSSASVATRSPSADSLSTSSAETMPARRLICSLT